METKRRRSRKSMLVCLLIFTFLAGFFTPVTAQTAQAKKATVKLSKKTVTLKNKKKYTLKVKKLPKKAKITWSITKGKKYISLSAKKKASVKIKAVKNGTAKVAAKIKLPNKKKKKKLTCTVKVKLPSPEIETPEPEETLPPHILPEGEAKWTISADGVLTAAELNNVYEVVVPDGVKEIGKEVFAFNHSVEKITFPEGLEKIDEKAFNECTRLGEVTLPSTMKSIGKDAFFECTSLKTVNLNDGLVSIGAGAFFQCNKLKNIVIPSSVTDVGAYCFAWCTNLEEAQIDAALTEIPNEMFSDCESMKKVNIPSTVKRIGNYAFSKMFNIESIVLPKGMDEIGRGAFDSSMIKDQQIDAKVIGVGAFGSTGLTEVNLSDRVEKMEEDAFVAIGDMDKGARFRIPASLTDLTVGALKNMNVNYFEVAEGNPAFKSVDGVLFTADGKKLVAYPTYKKEVDTYTVPDGVEEICESAFWNSRIKKAIIFPDSLKKIGNDAFAHTKADRLVIPEGVTSIGDNVFSSCESSEVVLPDSIKEIGSGLFSTSGLLKKVTLPSGLKKIPYRTFMNAESLESIEIPDSVEEIDPEAFWGCKKLKDFGGLKFGDNANFTVKNGCLMDKTGEKLLGYPNMVEVDPEQLITVTIPDGVTEIGDYAFQTEIDVAFVPESVKKIGQYALGFHMEGDRKKKVSADDMVPDFHIVSKAKAAIEYAEENDVNLVSEEDPDYFYEHKVKIESEEEVAGKNVKKLPLKAGETAEMNVKGVETKHYFFSSDERIASVDDKGTITALKNGTTTIIEAVDTMYFCLEVTVTGGEDPTYEDGLIRFVDEDEESVAAWEKLYFKYNPNLWFSKVDYPATCTYSGNSYNAVTAPFFGRDSSNYKTFITDEYGEGGGEYFTTISENLKKELSGPKLNTDLMLYSGKKAKYGVDYLTVDGKATVTSLMHSIGTTPTYPNVISTSLYRSVADGFSGGNMALILEIEGRADKVSGMLLRGFSQYPSETEFLLNQGIKFKILDAGVRRFVIRPDTDPSISVKPYLRLQIQ